MNKFVAAPCKQLEYKSKSDVLNKVIEMKDDQLLKRIVVDPKVMVGKPIIQGTRLTVDFVLGLLAHGSLENDICKEYKGVTKEDIHACLLFATKTLQETEFMPLAS